jgi:hypothetical protein
MSRVLASVIGEVGGQDKLAAKVMMSPGDALATA